ncbi:CPXCG motif-containing cysteine-rich protein [Dyella dinghuensis]|uniref:CPXCG motif-containing cysteine-rich protein n=1 Tax=Dyella dinghuensis TaxID=1920169 RepID=A0A432LUM5_9GAMM|nr:CPXCG motif-containing cysteine-rich protein [Dyella dinghuensis]RUL64203.1 CPXCG motif-containing cysteine-rich protein [Dyella dinghuensis]
MLNAQNIQCPYCGERIEILVDASAGDQRYIEDCQVCCRPISIEVWIDADDNPHVSVAGEDEA